MVFLRHLRRKVPGGCLSGRKKSPPAPREKTFPKRKENLTETRKRKNVHSVHLKGEKKKEAAKAFLKLGGTRRASNTRRTTPSQLEGGRKRGKKGCPF